MDLFSGAGGAGKGYADAGFDVVGVDIVPQPHYPFEFHRADALSYPLQGFDAIHASPPCQAYSTMTDGPRLWGVSGGPDLVAPVRELLLSAGVPFVVENVPRAPLRSPLMLCGTMFGLASQGYSLRRHRIFEGGGGLVLGWPPASCAHLGPALPVYGHAGGSSSRDGLVFPGTDAWAEGMGIDWMTGAELAEAIPPAYTRYIGAQLLAAVEERQRQ